MKIVEISRLDFENLLNDVYCPFFGFASRCSLHQFNSMTLISTDDSENYAFFKVPHNSTFQADLEDEKITVEIDDKSPIGTLETFIYRFVKPGLLKITDRAEHYEILTRSFPVNSIYDFHPPISYELISDREKWFRRQIQFLRGNELPMCWTNYDLVIRYQ